MTQSLNLNDIKLDLLRHDINDSYGVDISEEEMDRWGVVLDVYENLEAALKRHERRQNRDANELGLEILQKITSENGIEGPYALNMPIKDAKLGSLRKLKKIVERDYNLFFPALKLTLFGWLLIPIVFVSIFMLWGYQSWPWEAASLPILALVGVLGYLPRHFSGKVQDLVQEFVRMNYPFFVSKGVKIDGYTLCNSLVGKIGQYTWRTIIKSPYEDWLNKIPEHTLLMPEESYPDDWLEHYKIEIKNDQKTN